jgi:hypothetical protein
MCYFHKNNSSGTHHKVKIKSVPYCNDAYVREDNWKHG